MSRIVKSAVAALIVVVAFSAMAVGSAAAFHPLFLTQSGAELLVSGTSGRTLVRFRRNLLPVVVHCERDLFTNGWALPRSPLIHRALLLVHGRCILLANGMTTNCTEPIHFRRALLEIGLISSTNKKVALLYVPSEGTEIVSFTCGTNTVTLEGALVGEIPELNAKGENQYNRPLSEMEWVFEAESETEKQKLTEIFLLGTQMTKVEMTASGAGEGPTSFESTENIKGDGTVEICTKEPSACP